MDIREQLEYEARKGLYHDATGFTDADRKAYSDEVGEMLRRKDIERRFLERGGKLGKLCK